MRPQRLSRTLIRIAGVLLVCAPLYTASLFAQSTNDALQPTRDRLASLQTCLGPQNSELNDLKQGLLNGWKVWKSHHSGPPPPPPAEYLSSLDRDIEACAAASQIKDEARRQSILSAVRKDIAIKSEDCHKFGMGRAVPVSISTLRGSVTENGWEVFYRWISSSDFQPEEVRVPQLTSPAVVALPPGQYAIRAQKKLSDTQTQTIAETTIVVGLQPTTDLQLAIE